MKAAHNFGGPQIKRFVLLSSAVAVLDSGQDMSVAGKDYTEKDWNPVGRLCRIHNSANRMARLPKKKQLKPNPRFWAIMPQRNLANKQHGIFSLLLSRSLILRSLIPM